MGFWFQVRNLILIEPGRFEGIRELPWDLPGCLIGTDVVPDLKRKELLDINNSSCTPRISPDWLKLSPGRQFLVRFFIGLESSSEIGYSQMDGLRNL
ncbi:hypothetical protein F2Q70_00024855 [Brassica cretica]|uniref:Uncharacterized protein n=1 Tax=Brassica cretica TaxID=69181 RepID=A0A8S9IDW9_BRACR|nr:hypothetical protein F2Q68_00024203 [Brassica cretica]KAF2601945.1 hypothetical protein F2Q70_00024855 [Brassica cretica]